MTGIPFPMIDGTTTETQIEQINGYINSYANKASEILNNIGLDNLNESLAERINKGLTKHQSLEIYATLASLTEAKRKIDKLVDNVEQWCKGNLYPKANMERDNVKRTYMTEEYMTRWNMSLEMYGKVDCNNILAQKSDLNFVTTSSFEALDYTVNGGILTSGLAGDIASLERKVAKL